MNKFNKFARTATTVSLLLAVVQAGAYDRLPWPDGRKVNVIHGVEQVDLSSLRSGVRGKAVDRHFVTSDAMFLASEMYLSGTEFFLRASERGLPISNDPQLSYIANVEAYWYSRYNLGGLTIRSRNGIGVIHGPYVDLAAKHSTTLNRFGRDRGEMNFSNKDIMLSKILDSYLTRTGMPHKFDNAVPLMLEFKSALPSLQKPVNITKSPETGRSVYKDDFAGLQWGQDDMDTTIDMGGVAQAMLKKILWAKFFLRRNHTDADFPGEVFLGQNAEDGLRGAMLTLESVSTMLMTKSALMAKKGKSSSFFGLGGDSYQLTGVNPFHYKPKDGFIFIPHEVLPQLIYMGDMPVRHYGISIKDSSSQLWDQASWLWATSEYFNFSNLRKRNSWNAVFGKQTPYDGSLMEQKYNLLAEGLANMVFDNMEAMHTRNGVLVSSWSDGKKSDSVAIKDLALSMVALEHYIRYVDDQPERVSRARTLLKNQAEFLLRAQEKDGGFAGNLQVSDPSKVGAESATSLAFGILGLVAANDIVADSRYAEAARKASHLLNTQYWDDSNWLYRNQVANNVVEYTPVDVAALLGSLREMSLLDNDVQLLQRYKKFFVQAVDVSGMQQAETTYTGENINVVRTGETDSDHDGIPFLGTKRDGLRLASVFAERVRFDLNSKHDQRISASPKVIVQTGKELFRTNCAVCHGAGGEGNEGPRLIDNPYVQQSDKSAVIATVKFGRTAAGMPAWGKSLTKQQISEVADYIRSLK